MIFKSDKNLREDVLRISRQASHRNRPKTVVMSKELYDSYIQSVSDRPTETGQLVREGKKIPRMWGMDIEKDLTLGVNEFRFEGVV